MSSSFYYLSSDIQSLNFSETYDTLEKAKEAAKKILKETSAVQVTIYYSKPLNKFKKINALLSIFKNGKELDELLREIAETLESYTKSYSCSQNNKKVLKKYENYFWDLKKKSQEDRAEDLRTFVKKHYQMVSEDFCESNDEKVGVFKKKLTKYKFEWKEKEK